MDTATNTRPLLQQSETDSDFEDDLQVDRSLENLDSEVVVVTKDTKPLFKSREPNDRAPSKPALMARGISDRYFSDFRSRPRVSQLLRHQITLEVSREMVVKLSSENEGNGMIVTEFGGDTFRQFGYTIDTLSADGKMLILIFNAVYITFYLLGTTVLLPWFFFITAEEYWMYKFRKLPGNLTSIIGTEEKTDLQASFNSYISIASTVPSTIFLIIYPMCSHKIPLNVRMVGSFASLLVFFIVTTVFVEINTDQWQDTFFLLTIVIVVLLNIASAILQSALFGIVGRFPARYITATVSGQALGGVLAALAEIVSLWVGASPVRSALVYFVMADTFILIAMFGYLLVSKTVFFKYYLMDSVDYGPVNEPPIVRQLNYGAILKKIWVQGMSVWFCFVVTLSLYPAITALVTPEFEDCNSDWNQIYFVPVVAYLLLSVMDYLGRIFSGLLEWIWVQGMSVWFCFVVTLSLYPAITALVTPSLRTATLIGIDERTINSPHSLVLPKKTMRAFNSPH
ncbi:epsin [Homalodisca vitripennis]|nr:epsin [Homalodisca vitripennis]